MTDAQKKVCNYIINRLEGVTLNPGMSGMTQEEINIWLDAYKNCSRDVVTIITALRDTAEID